MHYLHSCCASGGGTTVEFLVTDQLGISEWREAAPFDVVTCMFAVHYFFFSEAALKRFLENVSINLKPGASWKVENVYSHASCEARAFDPFEHRFENVVHANRLRHVCFRPCIAHRGWSDLIGTLRIVKIKS